MAKSGYDDLFNVSMTKAEQSAADEIWKYIQDNSVGLSVFNIPENTRTNLTIEEVLILEKNKKSRTLKKNSFIVTRRGSIPVIDIEQEDFPFETQVHRIYSPEGNEIWVPTFEIAVHPSVRFSSIIENNSFSSKNILMEISRSICKEIDAQVCNLLESSFTNSFGLQKFDEIILDLFGDAYDSIIIPRSFIGDTRIVWEKEISDDDYSVKNVGYIKQDKFGNIRKIPVHFVDQDFIFFVPKRAGCLIINHKPYVIKNREAQKLRVSIVAFMSIGLVAFQNISDCYILKDNILSSQGLS